MQELEGDLSTAKLPANLTESIRLRLQNVASSDSALERLLECTAILGGAFTFEVLQPVWALVCEQGRQAEAEGEGEGEGEAAMSVVQRALERRLLKHINLGSHQAGLCALRLCMAPRGGSGGSPLALFIASR